MYHYLLYLLSFEITRVFLQDSSLNIEHIIIRNVTFIHFVNFTDSYEL